MKKSAILLLAALACGSVRAEEGNGFYFTDAIMMPGGTTNIELCMKNSAADLTCLEAEIQLPEGLNIMTDEDGEPVCRLIRNRIPDHEILANILPNGNLKLLVSSSDTNVIASGEGPLLSFQVQASIDMLSGNYEMETVGETLLVTDNADAHYSTGIKGTVTLTDDATSVVSPLKEAKEGAIYNLAGQRIARKQRGINIVGGRKELQK